VATCNTKNVVFSFNQMLAHHTAGGCPLRTGDLVATGTLSGPTTRQLGCLLEATKHGKESYEIEAENGGEPNVSRRYLEDGDVIEMKAQARGKAGNVGFGSCRGRIEAAS
jgi:fumarylacetoacetase